MSKRTIWRFIVVLMIGCFVLLLLNFPRVLGAIITWRMRIEAARTDTLIADVSIIEYTDKTKAERYANIWYTHGGTMRADIVNSGFPNKTTTVIKNDRGLWIQEDSIPVIKWQDAADNELDCNSLAKYFRVIDSSEWPDSLRFTGIKQCGGSTCLVLTSQEGIEEHVYYVALKEFRLYQYMRVDPDGGISYAWHNVRTNVPIIADTFSPVVPTSVPLVSIHNLGISDSNGIVGVPYNLETVVLQQKECDKGYQTWRLDPVQVAVSFIEVYFSDLIEDGLRPNDLKLADSMEPNAIVLVSRNHELQKIYLQQLARKGIEGIWTVVKYQLAVGD